MFALRKGRFFVAVGLRHVLLNKRSDDDVMDASVLDLDAVFDHLRHGFRPQVAGVCCCPDMNASIPQSAAKKKRIPAHLLLFTWVKTK